MEQNAVRKLVSYATALTLLGSPLTLNALGLGRLVVNSPIDTPLVAEIELTALGAADLGTIEVALASRQEFDNATIDRAQILQQLQFEIDRRDDSTPIIRVTSQQAISEPFLQFLITVQWPGGKLIREYTALLDPPLYAGGQGNNSVDTAVTGSGTDDAVTGSGSINTQTIESARNLNETVESDSSTQIVTGGIDSGSQVTTRSGDTLTEIASTVVIPDGVNLYQAMLEIQQANPNAFIDGNMNRLKRGVELTIPDFSGNIVSSAEARQQFSNQLAAFERFRQGAASSAPTQTAVATAPTVAEPAEPTAGSDAPAAQAPAVDELPETENQASESTAAAGTVDTDGQLRISKANVAEDASEKSKLLSQLSQAEEQVSSLDAENQELRERLALLETKVEQSTRLAQIEQTRMAELEAQAKAAVQARADAAKDVEAAEKLRLQQAELERTQQAEQQRLAAEMAQKQLDEQSQASANNTDSAAGTATGVVDQATDRVAETGEQVADTTAAAVDKAKSAPGSFLDTAKSKVENLLGGGENAESAETGGAQGGIMSKITGMFGSLADAAKSLLAGSWAMMGAFGLIVLGLIGLIVWRRRRSIAEFEESILSGSALDIQTDTHETGTASTAATDTSFLSEFGVPGMGGMQTDEVDPIAEAEVYMAYGRDEQAEEVLKEAINRDSRPELKLKLLEIYRSRNEVKEFETLAEELYPAHGNEPDEVWRKVVEMGQQVSPGNPLFKGGVVAASAAAVGAAIAGGGVANATAAGQAPVDAVATQSISEAGAATAVAAEAFPEPQRDSSVESELDQLTQQAELANPSLEAFQLNDLERSQPGELGDNSMNFDAAISSEAAGVESGFGSQMAEQDSAEFGSLSTENIEPGFASNSGSDDEIEYEFEGLSTADLSTEHTSNTVAQDVLNLDRSSLGDTDNDGLDFEQQAGISFDAEDSSMSADDDESGGLGIGTGVAAAGAAVAGLGAGIAGSVAAKTGDLGDSIGDGLSESKENVREMFSRAADPLPDDLSLASLTDGVDDVDTVELDSNGGLLSDDNGIGLDIDNISFDTTEEAALRQGEDEADPSFGVPGSDGNSDNATKLDLAKAYRDMGDDIGARGFLEEVIKNGNDQQRKEAADLMSQIESA